MTATAMRTFLYYGIVIDLVYEQSFFIYNIPVNAQHIFKTRKLYIELFFTWPQPSWFYHQSI